MIGRRLLQLVVHTLLLMTGILTNIIKPFKHHFRWLDLLGALIIIASVVILWGSVKLNWQLLKRQKFSLKIPRTSWLHVALIPLAFIIIYFAQLLKFYHAAHLSAYDLIILIPNWMLSLADIHSANLPIVTTNFGVYAFLYYLFIIGLVVTIYLLGLFSNDRNIQGNVISSRPLLWSQITLGILLVTFLLLLEYRFYRNTLSFVGEVRRHPDLLNTWNVGRCFFDLVSIILLAIYATWILIDGIKLWKGNRLRQVNV